MNFITDFFKGINRQSAPGLLLVSLIGAAAWFLSASIGVIDRITLAILLGILVGNLLPGMARYKSGIRFCEKSLLSLAIGLLGVELQLGLLAELGLMGVLVILIIVPLTVGLAYWIGRLFGFSRDFSLLIGAGNAVCGSSAIAAVAATIDSKEEDTGLSITIINLLGTIGIFLAPALAALVGLGVIQSGVFAGGSLQAVGQVVAAGYSIGDEVGNIAIVIKMGRVLLLGPLVLVLGSMLASSTAGDGRAKVKIPLFIVGFFMMSILASSGILPPQIVEWIRLAGKIFLLLAMTAIGLSIQFKSLVQRAPKAFGYGAIIAILQVIVVMILVLMLFAN